MRIENAVQEYLTGKYEIVLVKNNERKTDLEFSLNPTELDKLELMSCQQNLSDEKYEHKNKELSRQKDVMLKIIEQSYPTLSKEQCKNLWIKFGDELLLELKFIWGWINREAYEALQIRQKKLIQDIKDGKNIDVTGAQ